jgi:hydroxyquinol 1,2-dioxygenase
MMRVLSGENLTETVLASFESSTSPRYKEVMQSLVGHLHDFVEEIEPTEEEWFEAIRFLTRTGQIANADRQEFILLSDTLGVSMLVVGINHRKATGAAESAGGGEKVGVRDSPETGATEATVFGPFFVEGAPLYENGDDIANGAPGESCFVEGRVRSTNGDSVPNARLEVWQADEEGLYDVEREGLSEARGRGHLYADGEGRFHFRTVRPEPYPIPYDGPVGDMLKAANRSPMRPAHIHFMVSAPGYETVTTHVFAAGDGYLDSDAVFGVKESLIADFVRHEAGTAPDGTQVNAPFYSVRYDFVLAPSKEPG